MATVLRVLHEALRHIAIMLQPYMPGTMDKLLTQLGVAESTRDFASLAIPLEAGIALPAPQGLFPRYVEPENAA